MGKRLTVRKLLYKRRADAKQELHGCHMYGDPTGTRIECLERDIEQINFLFECLNERDANAE